MRVGEEVDVGSRVGVNVNSGAAVRLGSETAAEVLAGTITKEGETGEQAAVKTAKMIINWRKGGRGMTHQGIGPRVGEQTIS